MHAQITMTGNVGTDVELHGGGAQEWTYANFRLAHTPRYLRNGGWSDGPTLWISVTCKNRQLAENVKGSIAKGDPVVVTGRLVINTYVSGEQTVERLLLEASNVGHDLCRGTSAFRRNERATPDPTAADPGGLDSAEADEDPGVPVGSTARVDAA